MMTQTAKPARFKTLDHALGGFTGTNHYYTHFIINPVERAPFVYTDGLKFMAEKYSAYWLLDVVFSHAMVLLQADPGEKTAFLACKLTVDANDKAVFIVEDGNDTQLARQDIEYTDFPAHELTIWVVNGVGMLPSEY